MKRSEQFKDSEECITPESFAEIYSKIKYEQFISGDTVFSKGDFGNKFYIILKGSVSVLMPVNVARGAHTGNEPNAAGSSTNNLMDSQSS
jgi:hypothetical protein